MDKEGFRSRLKQYKEAKGFDPLLKYWEWKQKYDAAPQSDNMPGLPQPDLATPVSQQLEDRAHRWDNGYVQTNRQSLDSPYEDARYYDYRKPRFEFRKGDVHYGNPNLLKFMGRLGKVLRGGSLLGETILNLFPSEEAELIEDLRVKMDKQNKWLTGLEDIPKYDEGTSNVTYNPIELQRNLQRVLNTTPEGEVNPFYNSLDDTYGTVNTPEVVITAPYTRKASLSQQARLGRKAYYNAGKKVAPLLATIPLSAGILGTASTLGWGTAMDLADIATNPTDPLSYIDKFDIAAFKKVDPMSKNAKPVSDKVFIDDTRVAGSTTTKPTYLDYGTVSFEDTFLNERQQWVKDVQEFYDTDVATRERNAASTAGVYYYMPFTKSRSKLTFNAERPVYVREYLNDVDFGGYALKDRVVIDKNSPFTPDEVLVHEGAHLDQLNGETLPFNLMANSDTRETIASFVTNTHRDPKYKSFLLDALDNAYEFTEDFGKNIHKTLESGATNREMRYNIWLKNNKPNVDELNNIIDEMSDDDIIYMLTQTNAYSRNVHKNLLEKGKDKKDVAASIRTALKTVPVLGTPIILNSTNDTQPQFAEGGEVGQRQLILNRANKVATNYSDAKDFTLDPLNYAVRKIAKTLTGRGGISNCTLSATGWVDPNNQYMSARNIFDNPDSGYIEIDKAYALPGDLLISKNPTKDSYHTMLIEGFNGDDPLLRYSRGGHNTEKNLVTGRSLAEYHRLDNEQGGNHTEDHYFRYRLPNEYWLPEIIVTPKR